MLTAPPQLCLHSSSSAIRVEGWMVPLQPSQSTKPSPEPSGYIHTAGDWIKLINYIFKHVFSTAPLYTIQQKNLLLPRRICSLGRKEDKNTIENG